MDSTYNQPQKDFNIESTSHNSSYVEDTLTGARTSCSHGALQLNQYCAFDKNHTAPVFSNPDQQITFDDVSVQPDHATLRGARTLFFKHFSKDELNRRELWQKPDFRDIDLKFLIRDYKEWVKQPVYLVFRDLNTGEVIHRRGAKRGNATYRYHLNRAIDEKTKFMDKEGFAERYLLHGSRGQEETRALFITLTWNPNLFLGSRSKPWLSASYFYNKFITRFRKKYGKIWVLRATESTK